MRRPFCKAMPHAAGVMVRYKLVKKGYVLFPHRWKQDIALGMSALLRLHRLFMAAARIPAAHPAAGGD